MIELGASTLGFRHDSLDVALDTISALGFRKVDLLMISGYCPHFNPLTAGASEKEALKARLARLGLSVATLNTGEGLLGVPAQRDLLLEYARASLDLARELGAYAITIQSGIEPPPGRWSEVAHQVAPDIRALGDYARDRGLDLTLELHKTMLMSNSREALDLMAIVDHPNVGVALDPSHITYAGELADEVACDLGAWVKHVHLRDGRGKSILVVPGDGTVDFVALAGALKSIGYERSAVIELEYEFARAETVRADLARSKALLEQAFAAAA